MECVSTGPRRVTVELPDIVVHNRYKPLSRRLSEVLEVVGASYEMRQHWRKWSAYYETSNTLCLLPPYDCYIFGSSYEGTTTKGMYPDVDVVEVYNDIDIITNLSEASDGDCLLLIQDGSTPPGYCKLQPLHNRVPMTKVDKGWQNRYEELTIRNVGRNQLLCTYGGFGKENGFMRHGPAERCGGFDRVFALRCFSSADCVTDWFKRKRKYNWPSSNLINICSTLGFLLVAVGHPNSCEQELQWRLSFSHQERLLVERFNSVQFKCYIVLKYIRMEIQDNNSKELFLSSYHLKTAMFHLIENMPRNFWKPENLVSCVIAALEMIRGWIKTDNCPNYFIPDENMFEGKTDENTRNILSNAIQQLLSSGFEYFISQIQRDSLGQLMTNSPQSQIYQNKKTDVQEFIIEKLRVCVQNCLLPRNNSLTRYYDSNIEQFISNLTELLCTVANEISQEQRREKQKAWVLLLSFIQVSILSNCVALDIQKSRSTFLTCDSWRELHLKLDSSKLKQAALMLNLGFIKDSLDSLASLEHVSRLSICICRHDEEALNASDLLTAGVSSDLTPEEILRDIVSPCVVFLPYESNVTPIAIRYEMIRSFGMPSEPRDDIYGDWYDWGVVDGRFLRHFLLHRNYLKLESNDPAVASIHDMINLLNEKVSHRETCFNLLGWVFNQYRLINLAYLYFKKSLLVQPTHNAALWHMCFLILDLLGGQSQRIQSE